MSLWLIPLAPLAAAVIAGILALTRRAEKSAPYVTAAATLAAGWIALSSGYGGKEHAAPLVETSWLSIPPNFHITLGVHLDSLAWIMVAVVVIVSTLVQIYSIGYMKGENGYARYFAYLALFTASMLGLVVANNLFQLYVCWELVGVCSYLLIGFWWHKPSAAAAAKKAFVVTRFGDVGFLLGVLMLAVAAGSFRFEDATRVMTSAAQGGPALSALVSNQTLLWLVPLLLFCGAIGKSAQFPLHVWLPDAMEGPTPVSALIHAATMVAAGVYMVARLMGIFEASALALDVVLMIGATTALIAATVALVQVDIKKVMAYSTVSQLGYMMLGLGTGGQSGQTAGMFHLVTHAFFKALLFLTAGSVIHALHHAADPNDLRQMGGLGKRMRITAATCLIGVLALAGFPLLSGFWSKDAILGVALERAGFFGGAAAGSWVPLFGAVAGLVVAALTAFYAMRMWLMAFWGEPRSDAAAHAHESPAVMTIPLIILAVPSILIGWALHNNHAFAGMLAGRTIEGEMHWELAGVASLLALAGMGLAWRIYAKPRLAADPIEKLPAPLYRTFAGLWGAETFWNRVGASGTLALGRTVAWFDRNVVDGAMNGIGWVTGQCGSILRRTTNGQAQSYAAVMMSAIILLAVFLVLTQGSLSRSRVGTNNSRNGPGPSMPASAANYSSLRPVDTQPAPNPGETEMILEMPRFARAPKGPGRS